MAGLANFVKEGLELPRNAAEEGSVSVVLRREGTTSWTSVLFIREHLVHVQKLLDEFLQSDIKDQYYITGPPGCGKTCFLYHWAREIAVLKQKRVLIVQFRECQRCFVWIRESDGVLWRMNHEVEPDELKAVEQSHFCPVCRGCLWTPHRESTKTV